MPEPLTPTDVRRLLSAHGLAPRKAAGQNFVVDPNTVRRIVAAAGVGHDDTVVEIGPGLGSLTVTLAQAVRRVVAIEVDAGLVRALADTVAGLDNVEVVHADALAVDLTALVGGQPAQLVANLPYNVATPLVMTVLAQHDVIDPLFVMVQREVGERWCARPGDPLYAAVSLKIALLAQARIALSIPRTVFYPVPNVDSVVVRLRRRADSPRGDERRRLLALADAAFAQRRKTLRNNLRALAPAEVVGAALRDAGIDPTARAETLDVDDLARVAHALDARSPGTLPTMR